MKILAALVILINNESITSVAIIVLMAILFILALAYISKSTDRRYEQMKHEASLLSTTAKSDDTISCPMCGGQGITHGFVTDYMDYTPISKPCHVCNGTGRLSNTISGDGTGTPLPALSRHDNIDDNSVKNSIQGTTYVPKLTERDNENKPPRYCK
jgi:hypothetical protein